MDGGEQRKMSRSAERSADEAGDGIVQSFSQSRGTVLRGSGQRGEEKQAGGGACEGGWIMHGSMVSD